MSGYCEIGRLLTVIRPTRTINIARTVANIGRSIKNLENIGVEGMMVDGFLVGEGEVGQDVILQYEA